MKIIEETYNRYGQEDYDTGYINWGFDDVEEQLDMASKVQALLPPQTASILDVACGIARYHQQWLKSGIEVTGIDISETFIRYARQFNQQYEGAQYLVCDFNDLPFENRFDAAVWTDPVELTGLAVNRAYRALRPGGVFLYEMWNDNYEKYHTSPRHNEARTWTCKDGVYHLIRHEYNRATSVTEHEEIIFDVPNDTMTHKKGLGGKKVNHHCAMQFLEAAGFRNVRFVDYDGQPFSPEAAHVKRFFMIGEK